jgi:lysophospholipase L1-like esterase
MTAHWQGAYRAAMTSSYDAFSFTPPQAFDTQTLRQIVHVHFGGSQLRLRISNRFGLTPLAIGGIRVAAHLGAGRIETGDNVAATFAGQPYVTLAAGETRLSDPVPVKVADDSDLAVSMFVDGPTPHASYKALALQTGYVGAGDQLSEAEPVDATETGSLYWLCGVDVFTDRDPGVIVAFGDSITAGNGTTPDTNNRYPDHLARALGRTVLNLGISANRLLRDGFGNSGVARFERDVLAVEGATHVLIQLGTNDLGQAARYNLPVPSAAELIGGLTALARRARYAGITPILATLPPARHTPYPGYLTDEGETIRVAVNEWVRGTGECQAVLDIDAALRDPQDPTRPRAELDSGDALHPNDAGAAAIVDAIDPAVFAD